MKKYFGQLLSFKYKDWKEPIEGIVLDHNDNWTLLKQNPTDYVIDGYIIFNHKNLEGYRREQGEKFTEKVITLKGIKASEKEIIPIDDLQTILSYLTKHFGVFSLHLKSEKACYLGRLLSYSSKELVIQFLNPRGKWSGRMTFRPGDIRTIEYDTDYINSLKLVASKKAS